MDYYGKIQWLNVGMDDFNTFGGFQQEFYLTNSQLKDLENYNKKNPTKVRKNYNMFNYMANRSIDILNLASRNNIEIVNFKNLNDYYKMKLTKCIYLMINDLQGKGVDIDFYYGIKDNVNFSGGTTFNYSTSYATQLGMYDKLPYEVRLIIDYLGIRDWEEVPYYNVPNDEMLNFLDPLSEDENKNVSLKINDTLKVDTDGNLGVIPINNIKAISPLEKTSDGSLKLNYSQKFKLDSNNNLDISSDLTDKTFYKFNTNLPNSTNVVSGDVLKVKSVENGEITEFEFGENGRNKILKYQWIHDTSNWELQDDGAVVFWKKPDDLAIKMFVSLSTADRVILSFELPLNAPQSEPIGKWVIGYNGVGVKVSWIDFQNSLELLDVDNNLFKVAFINEVFILTSTGIPLTGNMNPENFTYDSVNKYWDFSTKIKNELDKIGDAVELQGIPIKILTNKK